MKGNGYQKNLPQSPSFANGSAGFWREKFERFEREFSGWTEMPVVTGSGRLYIAL
jgi:hypothetical protein